LGYSSDTIAVRSPLRRVLVTGPSMAPALRHGDQLLVDVREVRRPPRPGDVVVVRLPDRPLSVKRVGRVDAGAMLWVEGDNPLGSTDSRDLGAVPADAVVGRVVARLWPRPGRVAPRGSSAADQEP
jgi:nickel-type superoxide dismutase maturation protease